MNIDIHINTRTMAQGRAAFRRDLRELFDRIEDNIFARVVNDRAFAIGDAGLLDKDGVIIASIRLSK